MKSKRKLNAWEIADNLVDALHQAAAENEETLNDELRRSGYDPNEVRQRGQAFIEGLKGRVRLAQAQRRQELLMGVLSRIKSSISSISDPEQRIHRWMSQEFGNEIPNSTLQALYHKLKTNEHEDLESLAQDAELLRMWEKIESEADEGARSE